MRTPIVHSPSFVTSNLPGQSNNEVKRKPRARVEHINVTFAYKPILSFTSTTHLLDNKLHLRLQHPKPFRITTTVIYNGYQQHHSPRQPGSWCSSSWTYGTSSTSCFRAIWTEQLASASDLDESNRSRTRKIQEKDGESV